MTLVRIVVPLGDDTVEPQRKGAIQSVLFPKGKIDMRNSLLPDIVVATMNSGAVISTVATDALARLQSPPTVQSTQCVQEYSSRQQSLRDISVASLTAMQVADMAANHFARKRLGAFEGCLDHTGTEGSGAKKSFCS